MAYTETGELIFGSATSQTTLHKNSRQCQVEETLSRRKGVT
jgi:hypothetical protein